MKLRFRGSSDELRLLEQALRKGEFEFVQEDEDYTIKQKTSDNGTIIGKRDNNFFIIFARDIIFIESFDHLIICHTINGDYELEDKLYQISEQLEEYGLVRVHKSYVVNKQQIKVIVPEFNRKFILILKNNAEIEVSRHYFSEFKKHIGMKVKQ